MSYASLHNHSSFSYDGLGSIEDWVLTAKKIGLEGLAITDHGNCSSALELYSYGKEHDFPIVMGQEFYIVADPFKKDKDNKYYHIVVWVKNNEGYKSLCRLSSLGFDAQRFYYKPRIGFDDLFAHKNGLMVGSACIAGPIGKCILDDKEDLAEEYVKLFKREMGEDFYLEIQPSIIDEVAREEMAKQGMDATNPQEKVNRKLIEYGRTYNIPLIATPDAHMPLLEHHDYHKLKLSIMTAGGFDFEQPYYMYSHEEIKKKFALNHPYIDDQTRDESLSNTLNVVEKAQGVYFDLDNPYGIFGPLLPDFKIEQHPLYVEGDTIEVLTYRIVKDNGRVDLTDQRYRERLNHEIKVLAFNGTINLLGYFLSIEDIVRWCRENGILHGVGRGSGAASLLNYGLCITSIDPVVHGLLFSRFINPARISKGTIPDIDMDFSNPDAVKEYVTNKYGADKVYAMSTIMTFKLKSAFKDIVRFKRPEMTFAQSNKFTQMLPDQPEGMSELDYLQYCVDNCPEFSMFLQENRDILNALEYIMGQQRQRGRHACSISISPIPLNEIVPTFVNKDTQLTQYDYKWCERIGVVKFDFLGLNTLNDIIDCTRMIKERHGVSIDIHKDGDIDYYDESVYRELKVGNTESMFQFNTDVARSILLKLTVPSKSIGDLSILTALGRRSTMLKGMHVQYIDRKNNVVPITYPHNSLKEILSETCGVIVFQEQVMKACQILAGFTESEADDIRRAMGKKKREVMETYAKRFVENTVQRHGTTEAEAKYLWELLESFSEYGFCAAHALAYAKTGYACMYLKKHYPLEWWCSVLKNHDKDKLVEYYPYVKHQLVLPNIVDGGFEYYINADGKIVVPLSFVKKVGGKVLAEITEQNNYSPFLSFQDFHGRVNRRIVRVDVMENLILAGVFAPLHPNMTTFDLIVELYKLRKQAIPKKFHHMDRLKMIKLEEECIPIRPVNYIEMFKDLIKENAFQYHDLDKMGNGMTITTAGIVTEVKFIKTAKGADMAFMTIRNKDETLSLTCWDSVITTSKPYMKKGAFLKIKGKINRYNNKMGVIPSTIEHLA